jgi:hypothetical protein
LFLCPEEEEEAAAFLEAAEDPVLEAVALALVTFIYN